MMKTHFKKIQDLVKNSTAATAVSKIQKPSNPAIPSVILMVVLANAVAVSVLYGTGQRGNDTVICDLVITGLIGFLSLSLYFNAKESTDSIPLWRNPKLIAFATTVVSTVSGLSIYMANATHLNTKKPPKSFRSASIISRILNVMQICILGKAFYRDNGENKTASYMIVIVFGLANFVLQTMMNNTYKYYITDDVPKIVTE